MVDKKDGNNVMFDYSSDSQDDHQQSIYQPKTTEFNSDEKISLQSENLSAVLISNTDEIDNDETLPSFDEEKNFISKQVVETVLDLKFVSSNTEQKSSIKKAGIDAMKLSGHNLGAFQAYQRVREQHIRNQSTLKYDSFGTKNSFSTQIANENSPIHQLKQTNNSFRSMIPNSKCNSKTVSCHVVKKTRRLADALITNLQEIKFFAGGVCDVCGRDSCDGLNHYPKETLVKKVIQVVSTDIDEVALPPIDNTKNNSLLSVQSPTAYVPYVNSKDDMASIFVQISDLSGIETPDSSNTDISHQSFRSDEIPDFPATFNIYFKHMELNVGGLEFIEFSDRAIKGFKLKYIFLMYKESIEFEMLIQGITVLIDSMKLHPFSMNLIIYRYLRNCCLLVELYDIPVNDKRKSKFLGNCNICFNDLLSLEKNSRSLKLLISDKERIAFVQSGKCTEFGHLFVDVSLVIDEDQLNNLAKTVTVKRSPIDIMGTGSYTDFIEHVQSGISLTRSRITLISNAQIMLLRDFDLVREPSKASLILNVYEKGLITEAEQRAFTDALRLVLVRNKALRTRQSEIDTELNDRAEWMHEELKWRLTLQEHAILSGKDPESVRWRQWRDENTTDVRFRTIMDDEIEYEPVVVITVQHLELLPLSQVMLDESIKLIYIEYAFLTHSGLELETKSLPKLAEGIIVYDFVKKFDISIHKENVDVQVLAEHIKTNQSIKFTAVHEPIEDPEELQTCAALGTCEINLFNMAQHVSNTHEGVYPLKNAKTGFQDVGYLKIRFDGVRAMRTVALTLLAPSAFRIYK